MNVKFKETVVITYRGDDIIFRFGCKEITLTCQDPELLSKVKSIEKKEKKHDDKVIELLKEHNLLAQDVKNRYINTKYEALFYFYENILNLKAPNEVIEMVQSKKVLILGAGGVGTVVADNLDRMGIDITIIDFDKVSISNLNRQLYYSLEDIGENKLDVLHKKIPNLKCYSKYIDNSDSLNNINLDNIDIIVGCIDTPKNILDIVDDIASKHSIPYIFAGVGLFTGTWGPLIIPSKNNLKFNKDELFTMSTKGSNPTTNMIISTLLAHDVIMYLSGIECENLFKSKIYNFISNKMEVIN